MGGVLERELERARRRHVGIALGALAGESEALRASGEVAKGSGRAPDADTLFEIGSVTKVFTGILLAEMALEGVVSLDEPLRELLPGVRVPARGGEITLAELASHSSGLPRSPPGLRRHALRRRDNPYGGFGEAEVLAALERTRLRSRPGERVRYSNFGAGVLGLALARRAGTGYEELLRARVLGPLALAHTGIAVPPERLARGHSRGGRQVSWWDAPGLPGAGALRSSARDLLRFLRACIDPPATRLGRALSLVQEPRQRLNRRLHVGLGWLLLHRDPWTIVWHGGGTGGFRSVVGVVPRRRQAVVALANDGRSVEGVGMRVLTDLAAI